MVLLVSFLDVAAGLYTHTQLPTSSAGLLVKGGVQRRVSTRYLRHRDTMMLADEVVRQSLTVANKVVIRELIAL